MFNKFEYSHNMEANSVAPASETDTSTCTIQPSVSLPAWQQAAYQVSRPPCQTWQRGKAGMGRAGRPVSDPARPGKTPPCSPENQFSSNQSFFRICWKKTFWCVRNEYKHKCRYILLCMLMQGWWNVEEGRKEVGRKGRGGGGGGDVENHACT